MPTPALRDLRAEIDALDAELAGVLARRFRIVDRVIAEKRAAGLPAALPDRIEEVAVNARRRAEALGLPPEGIERLWRVLIAETIRYEEDRLAPSAPETGGA
jgi:isochorismate pyruvate lyase